MRAFLCGVFERLVLKIPILLVLWCRLAINTVRGQHHRFTIFLLLFT